MERHLRGTATTRIDDKGRLKLPAMHRSVIEARYGPLLWITSFDRGQSVRVYPMPVWEEIELRLKDLGSLNRTRTRFLALANEFGQQVELDTQGRVVINQRLRQQAQISGDVVAIGQIDHLEVWNQEVRDAHVEYPTDEDWQVLTGRGI